MRPLIPNRALRTALHLVSAVVFLGGGYLARERFLATRAETPVKPPKPTRVLVTTAPAEVKDHEIWVEGMGSVTAAQTLELVPEVSARVEWLDPAVIAGGFVAKDQEIVRLDPRDYRLNVRAQEGQVARAAYELKAESSRARVAKREWELLEKELSGGEGPPELDEEMALRKPHVESARIALQSARSALERAKLQATKTTLSAPMNALVVSESVEVGDLASPQKKIATLIGTDRLFVLVAIPVHRLSRLRIPGINAGPGQGSVARVQHHPGGEVLIEREGRIERLLGDLEPLGKMARLVVGIEDPFDLSRAVGERRLPLLIGAHVSIRIEAEPVKDAVQLPRVALRDGDRTWIMGPDDRLQVRPVDVVWRLEGSVVVAPGQLQPGERVVLSTIPNPVPGTLLVEEKGASKAAQAPEKAREARP